MIDTGRADRDRSIGKPLYFVWLRNFLGNECYGYERLMQEMFDYRFKVIVEMDSNRVSDCGSLRWNAIRDMHLLGYSISDLGAPNVLEVLVALAQRYMFFVEGITVSGIFKNIFLKNLGLLSFTNDHMDREKVRNILKKFVEREYDYCGNGGIFPLKNRPKESQAEIELWYQMQEYLIEKQVVVSPEGRFA